MRMNPPGAAIGEGQEPRPSLQPDFHPGLHRIARRARLLAAFSGLLACAGGGEIGPLPAADGAPHSSELRVRLRFGEGADLDLYVTDPRAETVYFANSPSHIGGTLSGDVRCDAPPPRVESVEFPRAASGRYRVGIDFPERCSRGVDTAEYSVLVEAPGLRREVRGEIPFGTFLKIVLEFDVPPDAP